MRTVIVRETIIFQIGIKRPIAMKRGVPIFSGENSGIYAASFGIPANNYGHTHRVKTFDRQWMFVYTTCKYKEYAMMARDIAKIFTTGGSQAVRLPKAFRLPGSTAHVRKVGQAVILEPMNTSTARWFDQLDNCGDEVLLASGRKQPRTPRRRVDL